MLKITPKVFSILSATHQAYLESYIEHYVGHPESYKDEEQIERINDHFDRLLEIYKDEHEILIGK